MQEEGTTTYVGIDETVSPPRILFDVQSDEQLVAFRDMFMSLASGADEVDLGHLGWVTFDGFEAFVLRAASPSWNPRTCIELEPAESTPAVRTRYTCLWTEQRDHWQTCVEMVDALITQGGPGHQYLENPACEIEIEFAFRESHTLPKNQA